MEVWGRTAGVCGVGRSLASGLRTPVGDRATTRDSWAISKPVWTVENGRVPRSPEGDRPLSLCGSQGARRPSVGGEGALSLGSPHHEFPKSHKILSLPLCVAGDRDFTPATHTHTHTHLRNRDSSMWPSLHSVRSYSIYILNDTNSEKNPCEYKLRLYCKMWAT